MEKERGIRLKLDIQGQLVGWILDVNGQGGWGGAWKLVNFHGPYMCIIPLNSLRYRIFQKKSCHCYYCCCTWNTATGMKCCLFSFISNLPSKKCENMNSLGWGFSIQENRMTHHDRTEQLCSVTMTEQSAPPNLIIVSCTWFLVLIAKGLI